ncbi:OST-HTH/LOTUS domain-containing protein [Microbacterium sp. P01]|uniref:OST-HTH/LOTUS domain-containing protein n=1 Tax=Microbacterium sp. P01 TaxID=3366261 RepID=UPI0036726418
MTAPAASAAEAEPSAAPKTRTSGSRRGKSTAKAVAPDAAPSDSSTADVVHAEATDTAEAKTGPARKQGRGAKNPPAPVSDGAATTEEPSATPVVDLPAFSSAGGPTGTVIAADDAPEGAEAAPPRKRANRRATSTSVAAATTAAPAEDPAEQQDDQGDEPVEDRHETATALLVRALRLGHDKDDTEWLHSSAVKTHMRRMDPSFSEKALGYRTFSDFVKARESVAELEETGHERLVRLRDSDRE